MFLRPSPLTVTASPSGWRHGNYLEPGFEPQGEAGLNCLGLFVSRDKWLQPQLFPDQKAVHLNPRGTAFLLPGASAFVCLVPASCPP